MSFPNIFICRGAAPLDLRTATVRVELEQSLLLMLARDLEVLDAASKSSSKTGWPCPSCEQTTKPVMCRTFKLKPGQRLSAHESVWPGGKALGW